MKINRDLNLVIEIPRDKINVYIHSSPLSRAVFETHFEIMAKVFTAIYTEGYGSTVGPRIAAKLLRKISQNLNVWEGPEGVEATLSNEVKRLSTFISPGEKGWEQTTLDDAVRRKLIDEEEWDEVENNLVFFILASAVHRKVDRVPLLESAASLWGGRLVSLSPMAFINSLPTLKEGEISQPLDKEPQTLPHAHTGKAVARGTVTAEGLSVPS